jgi:hypothetical protein
MQITITHARHEGSELYVTHAVSLIFQPPLPLDKKPGPLYTSKRNVSHLWVGSDQGKQPSFNAWHEGPELYVTHAVSLIFQPPLPADKKPAPLYTSKRNVSHL